MNEEMFYVQLQNSKELRRAVLEATKLTIQVLQSYEKVKKIRLQKLEEMQKLLGLFSEINKICEDIKIEPPSLDLDIQDSKPAKKKKTVRETKEPTPEIKQLEMAISQIESKLSRLG
ncbi:MAG: hypothetical protein QXK37_00340 [Candidatus Woesearchaeota archaeon]